MKTAVLCLIAFSFAVCLALPVLADEPTSPTVETHLKRVALFKNGFGFFVREGTLTDAERVVLLGPFAAPSHGTYWITTPSRVKLASAISREISGHQQLAARSVSELLRGNVGRSVTLWLQGQPETSVTGKIISFAPDRLESRPEPYAMGRRPLDSSAGYYGYPGSSSGGPSRSGLGEYFLIQTDNGVMAISVSSVSRVNFPGDAPATTFPWATKQMQVEMTLGAPSRGDWVSVSYLARGITWAPSYLIDISDPKQARLSANALILNEAEDLSNTHVDLVTGFPHMQFADIMSPMGNKENLGQFLQSLARGPRHEDSSSVMSQIGGMSRAGDALGPMPEYGGMNAGQIVEDFFFYPLDNVSLMKNETGYYPLFTETVPYTEFYEWRVPDYIQEGWFQPSSRRDEILPPEEVWHSIRLTNTMAMPWTTAPAQVTKDGQLLSQDTLKYTSPSALATVKITKAMGIATDQIEAETVRDPKPVYLFRWIYERITVTGTLKVTNYTTERVPLEIVKTLSGTVMKTSPEANDVTLARGMRWLNPTHELTWSIELVPGETKEATYTYQAFVLR